MAQFTPVGVSFQAQNLNKYLSNLGKADKAQQNLGKSVTNVAGQFSTLGSGVLKFGGIVGGAAVAGVGALAAGIVALGVASVSTAISFESAFAGVIKTTDGLVDSMGNLTAAGTELREGFVELSKEVPLAFEELAAIGELGGQLGIGQDALLEFTETVAGLGVATNLSTEEAASGLARIGNIFNVEADQMGANISQLGSTIVALGNNFATTERDVLAFGERIAGAGAIAGLTQAEVLSIGAAMSSVGVQAEAGGTAVQKVLLAMNNAVIGTTSGFVDNSKAIDENVAKLTSLNANLVRAEAATGLTGAAIVQMRDDFIAAGGTAEEFGRQLGDTQRQKLFQAQVAINQLREETQLLRDTQGQPITTGALDKFARVAGIDAEKFKEAWQTDAAGAFQDFVEGLGAQGDEAVNTLKELGLQDQRLVRAFLSLAGAGDLLGDAIELGNKAFEENTALANEAAQRYATTESQLLILKNTIRAVGDTIGSRFLPFLNRLISLGKDVVNDFAGPIADAIDNRVIPAIESIIALAGELFMAFQTGGVAGLSAALGITPELIELIDKIVGSVSQLGNAILSFLVPGFDALAGGGLLDIINQAIIFLNQNFELLQGAVLGIGAVLAGAAIATIIGGIITVVTALASPVVAIIAVAALLGAAWAGNWLGIQDAVMSAWSFLLPIFQQILSWLQENIPIAIQFLSDLWVSTLLPALQEVGIFITGTLIPIFTDIVSWLQENIPTAIQTLANFWETVLLPAITSVWSFIQSSVIPLLESVGNVLTAIVGKAIEASAGLWQNVLLPALQDVWSFIQDNILPIFETAGSEIGEVFTPILENLGNVVLPLLIAGFEGIKGAIEGVTEFFNNLASTIRAFELPDVLNPGSPTPFEVALQGIADVLGGPLVSALIQFSDSVNRLITLPEIIAQSRLQVMQLNLALQNIALVTLPLLQAAMLQTTIAMIEALLLLIQQVMQVDLAIQNIYLITLPTLQAITIQTTQIMIASFLSVIPVVQQLVAVVIILQAALTAAAAKAAEMAEVMIDGFNEAAEAAENLADKVRTLTKEMDRLGAAAAQLARAGSVAASAAAGIGLAGTSLQAGTPPLGVTIPPGFNNDSFGPIFVESGERMLVVPRGGPSIEELVLSRTGGGGRIVNVNFGGITIANQMDEEMFISRVERVVTEAIG